MEIFSDRSIRRFPSGFAGYLAGSLITFGKDRQQQAGLKFSG